MKRWLTVLLVLLLLTGCAEEVPQNTATTPSKTVATEPAQSDPGLYDPAHILTRQTGGAVLAYPLDARGYALKVMGEKLLLSCVSEEGLKLTLLTGDNCVKTAETVLTGVDEGHEIWVSQDRVACYDPVANRLILLDGKLKEVERLSLPENEYLSMVMDSQLSALYYSVDSQICAFDLETGVSRLLRQSDGHSFYISSLEKDMLLQCWTVGEDGSRQKELISCQNGQIAYTGADLQSVSMAGDSWTAIHTDGPVTEYLYGCGDSIGLFVPGKEDLLADTLLPDGNILTMHGEDSNMWILDLYDMQMGALKASVTLKDTAEIALPQGNGLGLWFIASNPDAEDVLCCWKPEVSIAEPVQCLFTRYTREDPDVEGLARCREYAQKISEHYGITVSLEAPEALLRDYAFREEFHTDAIYAALEAIEKALTQFPERFYERVVRVTESRSFHISLVREITGAGGEAVPDGRGLQVWQDGDSYIVVAVGEDTLQQFYHQLWHMTETYVLSRHSALDTWDRANPKDFSYDESYQVYQDREESPYLQDPDRAFIDSFSMTFAREDRARVMEYAMMEGNEAIFASETMQAKLQALCLGMRKAFGWMEEEITLPWEQYLKEPVKDDPGFL